MLCSKLCYVPIVLYYAPPDCIFYSMHLGGHVHRVAHLPQGGCCPPRATLLLPWHLRVLHHVLQQGLQHYMCSWLQQLL
jgi:hypothetical protein